MNGCARGRAAGVAVGLALAAMGAVAPASAQAGPQGIDTGGKSVEWLIQSAVLAAPGSLREGAEVRAWTPDERLVVLRPGTNDLICLADRADQERFHVACYHDSLEPFMARGRELSRQGVPAAARNETRWREIESGELPMPVAGAVYNLDFADRDFDPATVDPATGTRLHAIYMSGATAASTGLPIQPGDGPWLMLPGTPSAHVMISLPARRDGADPGGGG